MLKKYAAFILILAFLLSVFCGCGTKQSSISFTAMDTYISIKADCGDDTLALAKERLQALSDELDCMNPSPLTDINNGKETQCSDTLLYAVQTAIDYSKKTDNAFNPCLYDIKLLWNIGGDIKIPASGEIDTALLSSDCQKIKIDGKSISANGAKIDLGGIAKGIAADTAVKILKEGGAADAVISLGGAVALIGSKQGGGYTVSVQDPRGESGEYIGVLTLGDCFISTSGDYQQYNIIDGVRYHHIFDNTGYPAKSGLVSVTVITKSGAGSDALSTAFFVMGYEKAVKYIESSDDEIEAVFVTDSGDVIITDGLREHFELNNEKYTLKYIK